MVATPGRLLDHITNSQGVDMDDGEFRILDEADRLLDLGLQDEVHEIVKSCACDFIPQPNKTDPSSERL